MRSPGKRGRLTGGAAPSHGGPSLLPQGRARFENFRTEIFGGRSSEAYGLTSAEMVALKCIAAARSALPPRRAPFGRRARSTSPDQARARHRTARPRVPRVAARPHLPLLGEECTSSRAQQEPEHRVLRSFPPRGHQRDGSESGTKLRIVAAEACRAVCGQTGTDRLGWYACPWLTLFATEWSAARKNPMRAAALHFSAAISADVKARRILTSGRRKFPSGNFRSARDLEGAERRRTRRKARHATPPQPSVPVCQRNEECPHSVPLADGPRGDAVDQRRREDLEPAA